ncbi:reps2 [Pungitius sinensis]
MRQSPPPPPPLHPSTPAFPPAAPPPPPGMEPEPGAAGTFVSLSEQEQRYYAALHGLCQADASGALSSGKVAELLKASQLPPECLRKVTELCGAKRLGYFGTPQFFVALKLLAAAQAALPVHLESVTANLPLPRFTGLKSEPEMKYAAVPPRAESQGPLSGTGSWTPDRRHPGDHGDRKEPRSPARSPSSSPPPAPLTHRGYPHAKRRNGSESLSASRPPAALAPHPSPGVHGTRPARDQQNLGDPPDESWRITEEQLEYYTTQFTSLQPDLGALILGTVAKNFFTKSKLPIPELSHIWELSDVDRDGALTFSEFCTAFHLIVARKNGFPLPESLPPPLRTGLAQPPQEVEEEEEEEQEQEEEEEEEEQDTPEGAEPLIVFEDAAPRPPLSRELENRLRSRTSERPHVSRGSRDQDGGVKTARDERRTLGLGASETSQDLDPHVRTRTRPRSYSSTSIEDAMRKAEGPPTPPPRPQKTHSRASSLDLNKLFQQGAAGLKSAWLPPPPALPPRPSASQAPQLFAAAEKTPQKKETQTNFADFSRFREEDVKEASHNPAPQKPIRRKYHAEGQNPEATPPPAKPYTMPPPAMPYATLTQPAQRLQSKQKREIQTAIRKNKETNAVLTRLNSELQQQLKVVHQERVTLETKLELQRPLAST